MKITTGGPKSIFQDAPLQARAFLSNRECRGRWQGSQRGLHLFIEVATIEAFDHKPFRGERIAAAGDGHPALQPLLQALQIDVAHGHPSGPLLGETILAALLCQLTGGSLEPSRTCDLKRTRDWIDANLTEAFSLEQVAMEAGVSVRHLHRAFPAETGLSPYRYIVSRRVERAKQLIRAGHLSLSQIAMAVGFCDQAHMSNTFRKVVGAPPSHFRNPAH